VPGDGGSVITHLRVTRRSRIYRLFTECFIPHG
jgi:hypothetical protein